MKSFLFTLIFILTIGKSFSQDLIVKINNDRIRCNIIAIDSNKIDFKLKHNGNLINSFINLENVKYYEFNGKRVILKSESESEPEFDRPKLNLSSYYFADSVEKMHPNFIYCQSGEIIIGKKVELESPFLRSAYMNVDSKKYDLSMVKFYKADDGFFANISDPEYTNEYSFVERIRKGKINFYQKISYNHNPGYYAYPGGFGGGFTTINISSYYNIGFSDLKKASLKNLEEDLQECPPSMWHLEKYRNANKAQVTLIISGGALIFTGLITWINKTNNWDEDTEPEPNINGNAAMIGIGGACLWATYFISLSKPKHLEAAIEKFNEYE